MVIWQRITYRPIEHQQYIESMELSAMHFPHWFQSYGQDQCIFQIFHGILVNSSLCGEILTWSKVNPFPYNPWFLHVCSTILLLVTSNFSFSHSVFCQFRELSGIFIKFEFVVCKLFPFGRVQNLSSGKGLNHTTD